MARIKIPFKGVTSQSNYQDGECKNIVNLRPKKGVYKPVTPRKVLQTLNDDYDIVFVHRGNDYENWIGVKKFTGVTPRSMVYYNIKSATPTLLADIADIVNGVQQIGNTLSFVANYDIYYALFINSAYKYLGALPDAPNVEVTALSSVSKTVKYVDEYDTPPPLPTVINGVVVDNTADTLINMTKGLAEILIDRNGNMFYDSFLIKWAYRLYDGSIVKHSPPILIMHQDAYKDVAYAYLHREFPSEGTYLPDSSVTLKFFTVRASYNFSFLSDWKDVIKSVDFFVTKYIGLQSPENIHRNFFIKSYDIGGGVYVSSLYYPNFRSAGDDYSDDPKDKVIGASQFYYYYGEENFNGPIVKTFPNPDVTVKNVFDNIIYQELMPADDFSNHRYGAEYATVMNDRLRLIGVNTILYGGMPINNYYLPYMFNGVPVPAPATPKTIIMVVLIRTDNGTKYVKSIGNVGNIYLNPYISYPDSRAFRIEFITYNPDNSNFQYTMVRSINLIPHPTLNIAYYLSDNLIPITFPSQNETIPNFIPPTGITYHNTITELNKIKVSEVNNPFVFPNENTYLVGSGKILAESSIVMNVSDRNYGMYPVFVFTTDGVFTMAGQDADTVHASIQSPTYLEPPISKVICATPYGVVFITNRGLMQISNYKTESLSEILREDDDVFNIDLAGITDPAAGYPSVSFREFLKTATSIVYNPYHDELIISASGYPYNYVYDYETKSFYLSTNLIGLMVQNTFPDVYYITDRELIDISQSESDIAKVALLTRPLQFQSTDTKKLERIFLRALMYNAQGVQIVAYHSMDGVNFSPIKGFTFGSGGNYKDFDLGLLARETFRQYLFLLTGEVDEKSEVDYIDCEVRLNYNNEKMR